MHTKKLKLCAALFCAAFTLANTVLAQSSRPGWGSTPYHDTSGTGVTFRVWAPNATSVYVPGTFNGWSTTATPLVEEQTNGAVDGVWSADVAGVTNLSQYKYYINNPYVSNNWKHDPRSRWVTNPGTAAARMTSFTIPRHSTGTATTSPTRR